MTSFSEFHKIKVDNFISFCRDMNYRTTLNEGMWDWLTANGYPQKSLSDKIGAAQLAGFNFGELFSVLDLFADSEVGVWYDPSDFSTMYQDSAGTTPVTAVGQPVGLMLDKSKGLTLGSELTTNGTFDSDTWWTKGTGWTIAGGVASHTGAAASLSRAGLLVVGKTYRITFTGTLLGSMNVYAGDAIAPIAAGSGPFTCTLTCTVSGTLQFYGASDYTIDNVSVKELSGNHATQATSLSRPILARHPATGKRNLLTYSEQFDNAAWAATRSSVAANATTAPDGVLTADRLVEDTSNNSHFIFQSQTVTNGASYAASIFAKQDTRRYLSLIVIGSTAASNTFFDLQTGVVVSTSANATSTIQDVGNGWYRCSIVVTTNATTAGIYPGISADGISPSYLGDGTSGLFIWGAQLEAGSTATAYQKTTTIYDTTEAGVADLNYLVFDGFDDSLVTASIDFSSTDEMSVFAGVSSSANVVGIVYELSVDTSANNGAFSCYATSSTRYEKAIRATVAQEGITSALKVLNTPYVLGSVIDLAAATAALRHNTRINGALDQTALFGGSTAGGNFGNYPLYLGRRASTSFPFNGRLYSLIVRGATSNATEIVSAEAYVNSKAKAY